MNRRQLSLVLFSVLMLAAGILVFRNRIRIETAFWHYRHGSQMTIGSYVVPVPKNWHVEEQGNNMGLLFRLDTENHTPTMRPEAHARILIFPQRPIAEADLDRVISLVMADTAKHGQEAVSKRTVNIEGQMISCYGGTGLKVPAQYDMHLITWTCMSSGGLNLSIMSTDPDFNQVWSIVSHIRRK